MLDETKTSNLLSCVVDVDCLANLASILDFLVFLVFAIVVGTMVWSIKGSPRSFFHLSALGMTATMSIDDVASLVEDQIGAVDPSDLDQLKRFSPKNATAPEDLDREVLERLEARGVVRRYIDKQNIETARVSPLGYRLLKDFAKVWQFDKNQKKQIWEWLNKRDGETLV